MNELLHADRSEVCTAVPSVDFIVHLLSLLWIACQKLLFYYCVISCDFDERVSYFLNHCSFFYFFRCWIFARWFFSFTVRICSLSGWSSSALRLIFSGVVFWVDFQSLLFPYYAEMARIFLILRLLLMIRQYIWWLRLYHGYTIRLSIIHI